MDKETTIQEIAKIIGCEAEIKKGSFNSFVDNPRELAEKILTFIEKDYITYLEMKEILLQRQQMRKP